MKFNLTNLSNMYLSFINDFITVKRFSEYYGVTEVAAKSIISRGRVAYYHLYPQSRSEFSIKPSSNLSTKNQSFFIKRNEERLLSEHSG